MKSDDKSDIMTALKRREKGCQPMKNVITVQNMRASDAHTIAQYVPSKELMQRAALAVYRSVTWKGKIAILTGGGNNGGDGYALACILADHGIPCCVYRVSDKFSEDGRYYHDMAIIKGVEMRRFEPEDTLDEYDILVDCMLGTGFYGQVRGRYRPAIEAINKSPAYVVCVDINSGMNGDTGKAELAVKSSLTVAIGYLKVGMFLGDSLWYIGKITVADIGIRLVRQNYFLAAVEEIVFPNSGLSLLGDRVELLTPGEIEQMVWGQQTIPEAAQTVALKNKMIVRVLGKHSLVTDGYRTYFIEEGKFPEEITVTYSK